MATKTVPAAASPAQVQMPPVRRQSLRGVDAEPVAQRIENAHAIALMLSEAQSEEPHIVHLARVILEQLQAARTELDSLTVVSTQPPAPASAAGCMQVAQP